MRNLFQYLLLAPILVPDLIKSVDNHEDEGLLPCGVIDEFSCRQSEVVGGRDYEHNDVYFLLSCKDGSSLQRIVVQSRCVDECNVQHPIVQERLVHRPNVLDVYLALRVVITVNHNLIQLVQWGNDVRPLIISVIIATDWDGMYFLHPTVISNVQDLAEYACTR